MVSLSRWVGDRRCARAGERAGAGQRALRERVDGRERGDAAVGRVCGERAALRSRPIVRMPAAAASSNLLVCDPTGRSYRAARPSYVLPLVAQVARSAFLARVARLRTAASGGGSAAGRVRRVA